jgi:tetratricopeptide (TPR) repeat protein
LKAIALQNTYAPAHANLGLNSIELQQYRPAATEFRKALKLDPAQSNANELRYNLALALYRSGEYEQSLQALEEIRDAGARDAAFFALAGSDHRELGRAAQAVENLRAASDREPDNANYLYDLAISLIQTGAKDEAIRRLEAGVGRCPKCASLYAALGVAYYAAGNNDESARHYETAVRLEPNAADIRAALGDLYAAAGAFEKSTHEYETALKLDPSNASYLLKQGRNWMRLRQSDKAEQTFRLVLAADSRNVDTYLNLGKLANERGDSVAAIRNLEKAVELDPENSAAIYQVGLAYRKAGQTQKSAAAMNRFRQLNAAKQ